MLLACVSALFSGLPIQTYIPLILPIATQEIAFAVWLIAKGFSAPTLAQWNARAGSV